MAELTETGVKPIPVVDISSLDESKGLTEVALCERLGFKKSAVANRYRRDSPEKFRQWTIDNDPDGIAWVKQNGKYYPVVE